MSMIDIWMYSIGSIFFIFALMFTYYSLQTVKLTKGSRGHQLATVSGMLFIVISLIGTLDAFFFPGSGLHLGIFFVWIVALFTLIYGGFLTGKAVQKVYPRSLLEIARKYPGSIYYLTAISVLVFCGIPVYLLDILWPISGEFSWYSVFNMAIWAFSFANLTFATRAYCLSDVKGGEKQGEVILFRDDILAASAYGALINKFLIATKPFVELIEQTLLEYFEYNPILFEDCKVKQDGTLDLEPIVRNIERIHPGNRIQEISTIFSALSSKLLRLYGAVTSPKYAEGLLAKSYRAVRETHRNSPVFFDILRSLPEGVLETDKIGLLGREELEVRVQERTRQLHKATVELERTKDYTDNIIKSMADSLIVVNPDGTIGTVNQTTLDLLGYQENELIGKSINIVFGEEQALLFEGSGLDDDSTKKGIVRNREKTYLSKDGRRIPTLFSSSIMRDDGKVQGIICVAHDITGRKKAEEDLKNSAREWNVTFDAMGNAVFLVNREGKILRCNRAMSSVLGKSFREIVGHPCWEVIHGISESRKECLLKQMQKSCRREKGTLEIDERFFEVVVDPLLDQAGSLIGAVHIMTDMTERRQTQQEIESLSRFPSENPNPVLRINTEGEILYANRAGRKVFKAQVGKKISDRYLPVLKKAASFKKEISLEEKIGRQYFSSAIRLIPEAGYFNMYSRNITKRKKSEEALRESENKLRNILASSPDAITVTNLGGNIIECNQATLDLHGFSSKEEFIGKNAFDLLAPKDRQRALQNAEKTLKEGFIKNVGYTFLTKEGSEFPGELSASVMRDAAGKPVSLVAITKDTTERKKAQKKIEAYQKRLRALVAELTLTEEREKRHLATELHDSISQLLALCRIKLGELEKVTRFSDSRPLVEEVEERLEEIIWHTRSLTLQLGPPVLYELGLGAALQWLAEHMQERYGIQTKFKIDRKAEPVDEELRVFLFRTVQELMMNVAKHAETDKAKISVLRENETVRIRVEDRGVGFNVDILDDPSGKDRGFGLFSIRERIKYFGGELSIQSKPGEGTQVTLMVPLK